MKLYLFENLSTVNYWWRIFLKEIHVPFMYTFDKEDQQIIDAELKKYGAVYYSCLVQVSDILNSYLEFETEGHAILFLLRFS